MIKEVLAVLKHENEMRLAYLFGQKLADLEHLKNGCHKRGVCILSVQFFAFMILNLRCRKKVNRSEPTEYLYYASSSNQLDAMSSTIERDNCPSGRRIVLLERQVVKKPELTAEVNVVAFGIFDILTATIVFLIKAPRLYLQLKKKKKITEIDAYFHKFCQAYIYVSYFLRMLKNINPEIIVVSNDHNVSNRCIISVAEFLDIRTAYMQHASISDLFPPLRFNFAFLDGMESLNQYMSCEKNAEFIDLRRKFPTIFLSGQKKKLSLKKDGKASACYVGVATNPLDKSSDILALIDRLRELDCSVKFRWHPGQASAFGAVGKELELLLNDVALRADVTLSDPRVESVNEFFEECKILIAGDSSIHLEAAISGVPSIYHSVSSGNIHDYYGFVRVGMILETSSLTGLTGATIATAIESFSERGAAIRYFSETFDSEWFGREGELVARTLELIRNEGSLLELYDYSNSKANPYVALYRIGL